MKKTLNIGFVTTLSGRWPRELPLQRMREYGDWLEGLSDIKLIKARELVSTREQAEAAISELGSADVVIMLYGAFTGDDIPCALADGLQKPVILWAPYEPPFNRDDRLYANALVSATMNAASLHRLGRTYHVLYGGKEDEKIAGSLKMLLRSYGLIKNLKGTMLGLFGYRPTAFYNSAFDESLIRKTFGIRIEETDLKVIFDRMEKTPEAALEADMNKLSAKFDTKSLPEGHLENHARLYLAMKELIPEQGYDFSVIKCWPEMGALKTTPCAVLGRLADDNIPVFCEGDVDAGLAAVVQKYLTGLPTFITDMINIDETENTLTFWHCGNAALSLMDPGDGITLNNHPLAGQGTAFYGSLKPGTVTIARYCNIGGAYKLFILKGEALATKRNTKGVMVNVKVRRPVRQILSEIFSKGVPHHYSIVYQDVADEMIAAAGLMDIEVYNAD